MLVPKRLLWVVVLLTVLWGAVMQVEMSGYVSQPGLFGTSALPAGCRHAHAPVIGDLELARDSECFTRLIAPVADWSPTISIDRNTNLRLVKLNTQLDFAFIALYWFTFVIFACIYWPRAGSDAPQSGTGLIKLLCCALIAAGSIAAVYDVRENHLLFSGFSNVAQGSLDFATPYWASRIKWCLVGVATFLLGVLAIKESHLLRKVFAVILILSGASIFGGTLVFSNPSFGVLGLSLALVLGLVVYFPWRIPSNLIVIWMVSAYLLRFQVISAFLLAIALPVGYFLAPSIFYGLFDAIAPFSFFLICFAALLLASIIMITSRLTLAYAPERFPDLSGTRDWMQSSWLPTTLFSILAVPMITLTWIGTQDPQFPWWERLGEVVLAMIAALLFLMVTSLVHAFLEDRSDSLTVSLLYPPFCLLRPRGTTPSSISLFAARVASHCLPPNLQLGIIRQQNVGGKSVPVLRSGHRLASTAFFTTLALYLAIGIATAPRWWEHGPAAMFYVLFLLCLLTWFFAGIAFFLDRLRVPVLTTVIAASMLISLAGGTDHVYELTRPSEPVTLLGPTDVIAKWAAHRADPGAPIVVVATAGGGIRAAAWTTQVLTGLAENCKVPGKNKFTSSVVLISSVSGGSEGAMYFAGWYDKSGNTDLTEVKEIRDESGESDLGAVGWGLLYPDLLRTVPGSGILNLLWPMRQHIDRGWALEKQWNKHWVNHKSSPTLSEWNADVASGTRPAVIFNATVAESGERYVAATTELYEQKLDQYRGTVQFFRRFQGADLPVSTAARLSATFPFVSPMARADTDRRHGDMHVGDGGYYDNSGLLSATQWLRGANQTLQDHQVILLIIDSTPGSAPLGEDWTWQRQTVAPINTLLGVRTSSQQLRARYEQDLLQDLLVQELGNQPEPLIPVYFRFKETSTTPLSWHLRPDQLREIGDQWSTIRNSGDAKKIYEVLHCPGPSQQDK